MIAFAVRFGAWPSSFLIQSQVHFTKTCSARILMTLITLLYLWQVRLFVVVDFYLGLWTIYIVIG